MTRKFYLPMVIIIYLLSWGVGSFAADGPNLLVNSGGEYSSGGLLPDYWTMFPTEQDAIYATDRTEFNSGTSSFKIQTLQDNHSGTIIYTHNNPNDERVMLAAGTKIKVGLSYKTSGFTPGLTGKIIFTIRRHHGWGVYDLQRFELDSDNTVWDTFEADFTIPSGLPAYPVPISVSVGIKNAKGTLWFDDVFIKIVEGTEDSVFPNKPTGLIANRRATNVIELKWDAPTAASDGDLPSMYKIYRNTFRGGIPEPNNLVYEAKAGDKKWCDYGVANGIRYYYIIGAMDKMGNYTYSNEVVASERVVYGQNLINNGSFEDLNDTNLPRLWSVVQKENFSVSETFKVDGNYSLKITNDIDTQYNYAGQLITISPNTKYTLIGWVKGDNIRRSANGNGAMLFTTVGIPGNKTYDGTFDWQFICLEFDSGGNTSITLNPYLHKSSGTVYFDGLGLYRSDSIDGMTPEPPVNVLATPVNGEEKVLLSWDAPGRAPDGNLADRYRVYRGSKLENMALMVELSANVTSWIDANASGNSQYYYYVTSLDKAGNESDPHEIVSVEKRSKVSGRVVALGDDNSYQPLTDVKLSLEGTELYTTSIEGGLFELKHLVAGDYELLAQAKNYQRKTVLFSVNAGGDLTLEEIVLEWDTILPNEPKNLIADGDSHVGIIVLNWEEPDPASDNEIAERYNIYRSQTDDVKRTADYFHASVKDTFYRDIGTEKDFGKTFYYLVEAVDGAGNISELSSNKDSATFITPPIPAPISPINRMLFIDETPFFEWNLSTNPDFKTFLIQISTDSSFPNDKTETKECTKLNYTWPQKLEESLWFWRIKALYNEVESSWSDTNEFVTISSENTTLVPYINVVPSIFRDDKVRIAYCLTNEADVELRVFNLGGKLVTNLVSLKQVAGYYEVIWTGKDLQGGELPNGLYLIQLLVTSGEGKREKVIKKIVIYR